MNGQIKTPTIQTVRALCDGLGIPRDLAGLAPQGGTHVSGGEENPANRNEFLRNIFGTTAAATLGSLVEMPERLSASATEQELRQLREATPKLLSLNDQVGGSDGLCRLATRLAARADVLLQRGISISEHTHEIQLLAGQLAMYAGWLFYDGGDQGNARAYWQQALFQSQLANDPLVEVYALESLSTQAAWFLSRPQEAISLAKRAQTVASGWASPRLKSLLLMREATGWAVQGDSREFERSYRTGASLFADEVTDDDPDWINFYVHAEVDGLRALAIMALGDHKRASSLFQKMVGQIGPELRRNQLYYVAMLGRETASAGDISTATDILLPHLSAISESGSWRTHRHVKAVAYQAKGSKSSKGVSFADAVFDFGL